jgi:hypothetical protein
LPDASFEKVPGSSARGRRHTLSTALDKYPAAGIVVWNRAVAEHRLPPELCR